MFQALRPILNKGGAGRYVTRAQSAERVMPVAERHIDLFEAYRGALAGLASGPAKVSIEAMMPLLRTEISKMSETLLSYGVTPPSGMGREPVAMGDTDAERLHTLVDHERGFGTALRDEVDAVFRVMRPEVPLLALIRAPTAPPIAMIPPIR